jgi:hypothetical protein
MPSGSYVRRAKLHAPEVTAMRVPTKITLSSLASLLMLLVVALPAAAQTPQGQGLMTVADEGVSNLVCSDPSVTAEDVIVTRGGGPPAWLPDGRMYVIQSISVEGTITTPEGSIPVSFAKVYGQKVGMGDEVVTCTFDQTAPGFEATGTVTLVRVH